MESDFLFKAKGYPCGLFAVSEGGVVDVDGSHRKWEVGSGKWKVESEKWKVESEKWKVESEKWKVRSGK